MDDDAEWLLRKAEFAPDEETEARYKFIAGRLAQNVETLIARWDRIAELESKLDLATGDADHLRGRLTETLSRLDVVSKEVEGMEALLEKEHNDLLAWKHRATSAEDRLDAARKYLKEVLGRTPYSTDKQLVAANALNELNGAVRHPVVERRELEWTPEMIAAYENYKPPKSE